MVDANMVFSSKNGRFIDDEPRSCGSEGAQV